MHSAIQYLRNVFKLSFLGIDFHFYNLQKNPTLIVNTRTVHKTFHIFPTLHAYMLYVT